MSDLEDRLRKVPTAKVPESMDTAVTRILAQGRAPHPRWVRLPVPLWGCGLACAVCLLAGTQLDRPSNPSPLRPLTVSVQTHDPAFKRIFVYEAATSGFFQQPKIPGQARQGDQDG